VCSHVYVLDFGRLVFEGTPDEMLSSDIVRAAYLGSEGVDTEIVQPDALSRGTVEPA
jgi:ABC-type cobalamin/Fe3+-siderophores transport system ATPase subunit